MTVPDFINGTYECFGGAFLAYNCIRLYKDKDIKGISILTAAFFASWGIWNLFYYPYLNQWLSFSGGIFVVIANITWVIMAVYYKRKMGLTCNLKNGTV